MGGDMMIKLVRQYHNRDGYDVIYESGRMVMYDADRLPGTVTGFIQSAGTVKHKTDKIFGRITEYSR
jgi:hypothetical protein